MLQHFSFKSMYENNQLPGWTFSFFYKQTRYSGDYLQDGSINWTSSSTPPDEETVKKMIHELMLFHVYD
ncbi:YheE family protein [Paenisporosarcina sp. TG20]|uniref:YheE family protein n=1 Tax=Paenisporosarcina sp. TG20 TaxID=1211706 RepID=UPI0002F5B3AD|nr:YheE family protein [Paenisporosarcina sp. TG20]